MTGRLARYRRIAALAEEPTPLRRLIAAAVAGAGAFVLVQLLFGALLGGEGAVLFASLALATAAATAAATMKAARAMVYGICAAAWLLGELLVAVLGGVLACLG